MKIYLASSSPRRQQLMREIGFDFEIARPTCDELEIPKETPKNMVKRLSIEKGMNILGKLSHRSGLFLIISADTTVVSPNGKKVLGKPKGREQAKKMLRTLSGKTHTVLTGYTIFLCGSGKLQKHWSHVVSTRVKMRKLRPQQVSDYVSSGEPMDKAGAYAAQGIGMCLIESIQGSYSNVVGLPMAELVIDLEKKFDVVPRWKT